MTSPELNEDALDATLFDIFGKKLMLARQALHRDDRTDALMLTLEALDNLYALMSHKVMGEDTKL